jgi:hypothetical protein
MSGLRTAAGASNLKAIVSTASSARLLNLHSLAAAPPDDPDYAALPLFVHPVLNRSLIVKHNARPGEEERAPRRFNATKVIFPFDPTDLGLGGQYMFVLPKDFAAHLSRQLEYEPEALQRDARVLSILDRLPTLDPFLVREVLAQNKLEVAGCYYQFSEPDKAHMLAFVESQIETLIKLCFGETKSVDDKVKRLSQLLLSDHESPELLPLQETFRLEGPKFSEAMFAWKGFLYYRWRAQELTPPLKATLKSLSRMNPRRYDTDMLRFVLSGKTLLEEAIAKAWREIGQKLKLYERAYSGLTQDQEPEHFRRFLMDGSTLFLSLGEQIGRLEQIVAYWDYRLSFHDTGGQSPEEVLDAMRDLLHGLSIWPNMRMSPRDRPTSESAAAAASA